MENEFVKPMIIKDPETGNEYKLDFTRASVKFAMERGFKINELADYMTMQIPKLFYYAFRANHKNVAENQADKIREAVFPKGLKDVHIQRLIALYNQAMTIGIVDLGEDEDEENPYVTM